MLDINNLINKALLAIKDWEEKDAKKILKQLRQVVVEQSLAQTDPALFSKIQKLIIYLRITAFSGLPDDDSADILQNHYLESFVIGVPMEDKLISKLFYVPYLVRDDLRKRLKQALLNNGQKLGQLTIGQWIAEFDKDFSVHNRVDSAPVEFVLQNQKAQTLTQIDKQRLKEILHVYDYTLVATLPATGEDLRNILNNVADEDEDMPSMGALPVDNSTREYFQAGQKQNSYNPTSQSQARNLVQMPLMQAMQKYPKLGEQIVSSNVLKLRIFPTPVRPSIKNWITDYHDYVGSGRHSAVDRGNYLFQGVNGKKLTPVERQRVSDMLKALDTEENVSIDGEKEMLVFGPIQNEVTAPVPSKDNMYITKVRNGTGPNLPTERALPTAGEQVDVFDRYAKKSFSPNFADKQAFVINKKNDPENDSVQQFRNATSTLPGNDEVALSSDNFHDFAKSKNENEIDGELSFSSSQKFSVEKEKNTVADSAHRQSWQRIDPFSKTDNKNENN